MDLSTQNSSQLGPDTQEFVKKLLRDMQTARMAFEEHMRGSLLEMHQSIEHEKIAWQQTKKDILADADRDIAAFQAAGKKVLQS